MPIHTHRASPSPYDDVPHISILETMQRIMDGGVPERLGLTRLQVFTFSWVCKCKCASVQYVVSYGTRFALPCPFPCHCH